MRNLVGVWVISLCLNPSLLNAAVLSPDLEIHLLNNVSTTWQTVALTNTYTETIPICTYNLASFSGAHPNYDYPPAVVRIRNTTTSSFDVRIQGWEDSAAVPGDVHCLVTDSGAHTLPDGRKYEAYTVLSDKTVGRLATDGNWNQANLEDVSATITNTYADPVVLGQVVSFADSRASVFHATDCDSRQGDPFQTGMADGICVGKHIGQIAGSRNSETIAYLVAEAGSGIVNGVAYTLDSGPDEVAGNNNANSGSSYTITGDYTIGVLTQQGEDGGDGSWAVLYGADPLPNNLLKLAVDEETVNRDTTRNHTREPIDYWLFSTAELTLQKAVVNDDGGTASNTDFTLEATGASGTVSGITGDLTVTDVAVAPGTYVLGETGPTGYTGTWQCDGGSLVGTDLTIGAGEDIICRLLNDDNPIVVKTTYLTLRKTVVNDNGGTATSGDFSLAFSDGGSNTGSGVDGDPAVTSVIIEPGVYSLKESAVAGYQLRSIKCDGLDVDGSDGLKIAEGEDITCEFINDDQGVDLEIAKSVSDLSPSVGDKLTFTLNVTNNGPDVATNVQIVDIVKPGFIYVAGTIAGGTTRQDSSPAGTGLNWTIASLASGASVTLTFQAMVSAP